MILRPARVNVYILVDLGERAFAILQSYIPDGCDILLGIEQRQFMRIPGIWIGRLSGSRIGVYYNQEMQVRVIVDAIVASPCQSQWSDIAGGELTQNAAAPMYSRPAGTCTKAR